MMVPVGRLVLLRSVVQKRNGQRARLSHDTRDDRPGGRAAARRFHHDIFSLALDFLDQCADRRSGHCAGAGVHRELCASEKVAPFDFPASSCRDSDSPPSFSALTLIGRGFVSAPVNAAMIVLGLGFARRLRQARARASRTPSSTSACFRRRHFSRRSSAASFSAIGIGAIPFLLPLMLQLGFGLSPFASGSLTFAAAAGAMTMKFSATAILRRFGFRRVLIVNADHQQRSSSPPTASSPRRRRAG